MADLEKEPGDEKPAPAVWRSADIEVRLRAHFSSPSYAVVTGVRNAAGHDATRTCDLLAMGTWKSVGILLHGVEIKVSRADWQREMQDPLKAEAFQKFCDYWWVAAPPGVVETGELSADWGLMEACGRGMRVRKMPARNRSAEPVSRSLLACIMRRVNEQSPAIAESKRLASEVRKAGYKDGLGYMEGRIQIMEAEHARRLEEARAVAVEIESVIGEKLSSWNVRSVAVRLARFFKSDKALEECNSRLEQIRRLVGVLDEEVADESGKS